jgi:hypothetical protein
MTSFTKQKRGGAIGQLDDKERIEMARSSKTSQAELYYLAGDPNKYVRYYVADNQHASAAALKLLHNDKDLNVRCRVANNHNTLPETLAQMAEDKNKYVRQYVAGNKKTALPILDKLTSDEDDAVAEVAKKTITSIIAYNTTIKWKSASVTIRKTPHKGK